ncbi:MAG: hypothetical protein NVS9B15_02980 [Acidobacteriaceae bacterium]
MKMKPPVASLKPTVAEYLAEKIDLSGRTQTEISELCGFKRPPMVSMLRYGRVRLPYDRIRTLARVLRIDHRELALLAIEEYDPELMKLLKL